MHGQQNIKISFYQLIVRAKPKNFGRQEIQLVFKSVS